MLISIVYIERSVEIDIGMDLVQLDLLAECVDVSIPNWKTDGTIEGVYSSPVWKPNINYLSSTLKHLGIGKSTQNISNQFNTILYILYISNLSEIVFSRDSCQTSKDLKDKMDIMCLRVPFE